MADACAGDPGAALVHHWWRKWPEGAGLESCIGEASPPAMPGGQRFRVDAARGGAPLYRHAGGTSI